MHSGIDFIASIDFFDFVYICHIIIYINIRAYPTVIMIFSMSPSSKLLAVTCLLRAVEVHCALSKHFLAVIVSKDNCGFK